MVPSADNNGTADISVILLAGAMALPSELSNFHGIIQRNFRARHIPRFRSILYVEKFLRLLCLTPRAS